MTTLAQKSPTEEKLYTFDLTPRLQAAGTSIAMISSVTASVGSVAASSIDSTGYKITVLLTGGSDGDEMKVTATYTTSDGQTLQASFDVPIVAI